MDRFDNITHNQNERAIRRGVRVPDGDINLAWAKAPALNPADNMVIVDTSLAIEENTSDEAESCKIVYANELGLLQEPWGNGSYKTLVLDEEYPFIGDMFNVDENFSTDSDTASNEYVNATVLTLRHVSRFFHIDLAGLAVGDIGHDYRSDVIKIVDSKGRDYVDEDGNKKYKIQLVATRTLDTEYETTDARSASQNAYRVWAFVASDALKEELYLTYNKIEVSTDGTFKNQNVGYRELLNPQQYFEYIPEESDVVDPANRDKKWYSSKATTLKNQILGDPISEHDGYKFYVPRKAVGDPRQFQLFRWRVACDFVEEIKVDPTEARTHINAAYIVTNAHPTLRRAYAFYNLERSQFNASGLKIINPLKEAESLTHPTTGETLLTPESKKLKEYWTINFDEITFEDLEKFDFLVWCMDSNVNFNKYLPLIQYFVQKVGGSIFFDTRQYFRPSNSFWGTTAPVQAPTGEKRQPGPTGTVMGRTIRPADKNNLIWNGQHYGGWGFNDGSDDEYRSINEAVFGPQGIITYWTPTCKVHYINSHPSDFTTLIHGTSSVSGEGNKPVLMFKESPTRGRNYICSMGLFSTVNDYMDPNGNYRVSWNEGDVVFDNGNTQQYIDNGAVEGAYKLLYNLLLLAKRGTVLDDRDETSFSTSWTLTSPWYSSWVIDGDVLSESERDRNNFEWRVKDITDTEQTWQRKLSENTLQEIIDKELKKTAEGQEQLRRIANMKRTYRMEVTNDNVETPATLTGTNRPYAWTDAFSPPFEIPRDLGPNVVLEEEIQGEFAAGEYVHKSYPPKPYEVQVSVDYISTTEHLLTETVTVTATGSAKETKTVTKPVVTNHAEVFWSTHGAKTMNGLTHVHNYGPWPKGISTWSDENYYNSIWGNSNLHWFHYGLFESLRIGSTGEVVMWVQDAMNRFMDLGVFTGYRLVVDGHYGPATSAAVLRFQQARAARYKDGVADAETFGLIGYQVLRFWNQLPHPGFFTNSHLKFYDYPGIAQIKNISDLSPLTGYTKRSWMSGGPSYISEVFGIRLPDPVKMLGLYISPWQPSRSTDTVRLDHIQVVRDHNSDPNAVHASLRNWNPAHAQVKNLNKIIRDGQRYWIPFGPWGGDQFNVSISSTGPSGYGNSHVIGIRNLSVLAEFKSGGETTVTTRTIPISYTKTVQVQSGKDTVLNLSPQGYTGGGTLSNIRWTNVTLNNSNVGYRYKEGKVTLQHSQVSVHGTANHTYGTSIPPSTGGGSGGGGGGGGTQYNGGAGPGLTLVNPATYGADFRSMDENGNLNPAPETGWISKTEGMKLLCDSNKKPIGFPPMPTDIGPKEQHKHYTTLSINTGIIDPSIRVGFYDIIHKEFIVDEFGEPRISFAEYKQRGRNNIFIGLISEYEVTEKKPLPNGDNAPKIPYRWAMPVYGICTTSRTRIGIEPLPSGLGPSDMWYVPIRTGKFNRSVTLPNRFTLPSTNEWRRDYAGQTVKAYYDVPEASLGGWSDLYGRPYTDIKGEHPLILDDNVIQVKQSPILMWTEPTSIPGAGDPMRPVFTVFTRETVASPWQEVSRIDVLDYNVQNGTIVLRNPLAAVNPDLVKVDYTTSRRTYHFKGSADSKLNLNPYPGHNRDLVGKAIYIYITPHYVKDIKTGRVIPESYTSRTLNWTTDPSLFNIYDPDYDPLALQLGVIYITTALDIDKLVLLDSRKRGGGAVDNANVEELKRLVQDAIGYWDIGYGAGMSYQKGGYVIVRLPRALEDQWPDEREIIDIIRRNITAGVEFKIEDLDGADW